MCLQKFLPQTVKDNIIKKITENGKRVYKTVRVIDGKHYPLFYDLHIPFEGTMEADPEARERLPWGAGDTEYKAGFHFWLHKKDAQIVADKITEHQNQGGYDLRDQFVDVEIKVITCIVKKSWISVLGIDRTNRHEARALIAKKAIFPKYRK